LNLKPKGKSVNNLITKKQVKNQFKEVIKTNILFKELLESITQNYPLHTQDEENLQQLQTHLINLNVHFAEMINTIK
jgi:hypothetical protein